LHVLRLPEVEAQALPGGPVVISESFVDQQALSDPALAFVLAHEMAHVILEHERQALSFALLLLPRQIVRSVRDMYVEMDYSLSLLKRMEPVMQQGEFEADELGLLMASAAGFDPDLQLVYLEQECSADTERRGLVATHPPACERLNTLKMLLPLARRQRAGG
jgi:predicted Zn-dependent protease